MKHTAINLAVAAALCTVGGLVHAQETQAEAGMEAEAQTTMENDALQGVEPVVPVGAPVVPVKTKTVVKQVGPAVVPVAPVEKMEAVETVTLNTDSGPLVVISFPGTVPSSAYNIDFTAIDDNDDGFISREESSAMASRSEAAHNLDVEFKIADKNADNRLAFTEILEWVY